MSWDRDWDRLFWPAACGVSILLVATLHLAASRGTPKESLPLTPGSRSQPMTDATESQRQSSQAPQYIEQPVIRSVFQCRQGAVTIFSDHQCGTNAEVRSIRAPNSMAAQPIDAEPATAAQTNWVAPENRTQSPTTRDNINDEVCREIQGEIDRIDARMRDGYSSGEGEVLRARRNKLTSERYDRRCTHVHSSAR